MKTQMRGNCQYCGCDQAVVKGVMSKHGYTVEHGWFNGVCPGNRYAPMQHDRKQADMMIDHINAEIVELTKATDALEAGTTRPEKVKESSRSNAPMIAWEDANEHSRRCAVENLINEGRYRARQGRIVAQFMKETLETVHGQPLREVTITDKPDAVLKGEQRWSNGFKLKVVRVEGVRVYWTSDRENGRAMASWTGIAAWRKLDKVQEITSI